MTTGPYAWRLIATISCIVLIILSVAPVHAQVQAPASPPQVIIPSEVPTDILFVLDGSGSMSRDDSRGKASDPQRYRFSAVRAFIALASPRMRIGLANLSDAYSGNNGMDRPTPLQTGLVQGLTDATPSGRAQLLAAVNEMKTTHEAGLEDGFTYMSKALDLASRVMNQSTAPQKYVIVLTDGDVTGENPRAWWTQARALQNNGVKFVIFRLGQREPPGLSNQELANINDSLAPAGGGAQVIARPEDILRYYLQTFITLNQNTYINPIGRIAGNEQPLMEIQEWMDISDVFLILPTSSTDAGKSLVRGIVSDKLGRNVLTETRGDGQTDPNLEVLLLNRERLGALEGLWKVQLSEPASDVQLVFRSRVTIFPDKLLAPKDADQAVVSVAVADGRIGIPSKKVVARGVAGESANPLLLGAFGANRYSGTVHPDREGLFRVRVLSESPQAAGVPVRRELPPALEKAFPVLFTDKFSAGEIGLTAARLTGEKVLKAGQPFQVGVKGDGGPCQPQAVALKVDANYPNPPVGVLPSEVGRAATPLGGAQGGGLAYGFVPNAPGQISFVLDHAALLCEGLPFPVGISTVGRKDGVQSFEIDIERTLKVDRDSPANLGVLATGIDTVDFAVKFDLSSYRPERLIFSIQGLPGASPITPTVDLQPREGDGRPRPIQGVIPIKVKLGTPLPGGAKRTMTLVIQQGNEGARSVDIGRQDFTFEVAAGIIGVRVSRDPKITRDGVTFSIAIDSSRLFVVPPATSQDFELGIEGLKVSRVEPKGFRVIPQKDLVEQLIFVQSEEMCARQGPFNFKIGIKTLPSPNGEILTAGSPLEISVPLPKMAVTVAVPEQIGPLRPGVTVPITLQSTSLCAEALRLRVFDPRKPDRFVESGLSAPNVFLAPTDGEIRSVQLLPVQSAPRGEEGTIVLETARVNGHPSTTVPSAMQLHYYTPLWTQEFPREAVLTFFGMTAALTLLFSFPRTLMADPIFAHQAGDSSIVSGRKRFRWFISSFTIAGVFAAFAVFWAMARYMP